MMYSMAGAYPQLYLEQWEGITPVVLPLHSITLSCINIATVGVSLPFFFFLLSMFYLLVPIWLENFKSDKTLHENAATPSKTEGGEMLGMIASGRATKMPPSDYQSMYGQRDENLYDMNQGERYGMRGGEFVDGFRRP